MIALIGNAILRLTGSAGGIVIGLYLAHLTGTHRGISAMLVGVLAATNSSAELVGAIPFGHLSDRWHPKSVLPIACLLGACATQLFGLTATIAIFYASRVLEGFSAAAATPSLLVYLASASKKSLRVRTQMMSVFEISVLAGWALGGPVGGPLFDWIGPSTFSILAAGYLLAGIFFYWGTYEQNLVRTSNIGLWQAMKKAWNEPILRKLAPIWVFVSATVGLWVINAPYQLSDKGVPGQAFSGGMDGMRVGIAFLVYSAAFGAGAVAWGWLLPRVNRVLAMKVCLGAVFVVCILLFIGNHSIGWPRWTRALLLTLVGLAIFFESGFSPAALTILAEVIGGHKGQGTDMGLYSVLLGLGTIIGALLGACLAEYLHFDGLLLGTFILAAAAGAFLYPRKAQEFAKPTGQQS